MGNLFSCASDDKFQSHKYSCYMSDFEKSSESVSISSL